MDPLERYKQLKAEAAAKKAAEAQQSSEPVLPPAKAPKTASSRRKKRGTLQAAADKVRRSARETARGSRSGGMDVNLFMESLAKFTESTIDEVVDLQQEFARKMLLGVVEKTPVLTGRARANWQIGLNAAGDTAVPDFGTGIWPNPLVSGYAMIDEAVIDDKIVLYNNVAYISDLENGWSDKAPQGMVGPTLAEVSAEMGGYIDALDRSSSIEDEGFDEGNIRGRIR